MITVERLCDVFVELADTLGDDVDVLELVRHLTVHAALICSADAVGVLLAGDDGRLQQPAGSDETGRLLEVLQLQVEEGPCIDCYLAVAPVVVEDLAAATDRWPRFAPAAAAAGIGSVHALPMRLRDRAIGALDLFGPAGAGFAAADVRVVQRLADVASIAVLRERALAAADARSEQLQSALDSRVVIEQAKGAIAEREGVAPAEAFQLLRQRARGSGRKLPVVAAEVVDQIEQRSPGDGPVRSR